MSNSSSHLMKPNWNPPESQLRVFGWLAFLCLLILGWRLSTISYVMPTMIGAGTLVALLGTLMPRALRPLFVGLTVLTMPIGWVIGELLLLVIYFLQITPISLFFKLLGRDELRLKIGRGESSSNTYWTQRTKNSPARSYFRQY